ncbi:MAG: AbrB/MazE/SpoVT family DNA-binding domain-containing protein [Candidatus Omnitrophica bacterium]|nr:AbrB/MazE/SpoVT family DNA-binding domain-containing protein [Candidatus Omnitrophota bacterium]
MIISKVLSKHQVTLPNQAVKALHLHKGDLLKCEIKKGEIRFKPVTVEETFTEEELDRMEKLAKDPKNKGKIFDDVQGALKYLDSLK